MKRKTNGAEDNPQTDRAETVVEEAARLMGEAPQPATFESVSKQLAEIQEQHQIAQDAKARWDFARQNAKECRELYDAAVNSLLAAIEKNTKRADLPLFDEATEPEQAADETH